VFIVLFKSFTDWLEGKADPMLTHKQL